MAFLGWMLRVAKHEFYFSCCFIRRFRHPSLADFAGASIPNSYRLENSGIVGPEMIKVQSGSYLGEDDIVRFEDTYGRS